MDSDNQLPLTEEHARAWVLQLLSAGTIAGVTPMSSEMLHRLVFLSNCLARLYDATPPSDFVLKHKRGPYYPRAQFELERMAAQGLVMLSQLRWTTQASDLQLHVSFSLSEQGRLLVRRWIEESMWCQQLQIFLTDLCTAVACIDDGKEVATADHDLTYDQSWASQYSVIAFRHPQERLSQRGAEEIADMSPPGLAPNRQHQLRLYLKYLERLAA